MFAWRNTTERTTAEADQVGLRVLADQCDPTGDGAGHRPRPRRLARPARAPAASNKPGELALAGLGSQRRESLRGETLAAEAREPRLDGLMAVDLVGDALPDILVDPPRRSPRCLARNLGNGQHWLAFELGGHWRVKPELMRTNSHAIGTRVLVEGQGLHVTYDHTTPETGLAPVDRAGRARPRPTRASRPGPSPLA